MRSAVLAVALLSFGCKKEPERPIVIGVVVPLTGPQASYGVSAKNGIDLAAKERKGVLLGRKLEVVTLDDQSQSAIAEDAARKLITEDKADVLIGDITSDAALAVAKVAQRALTPMITPAATDPHITEVGDHVFRLCFVDPLQADVMARFASEDLKLKKVAVVRDLGSEYSIALAEAFAKRFSELGGTVVATEPIQGDDASFAPVLEKVRAVGAEAMYAPLYQTEVRHLARERTEGVMLLGADGWDANELIAAAGRELEGSAFTTSFSADEPRPEVKRFADAYHQEYNELPDAVAALGYDAANYAMAAIIKADGTDQGEIRSAIASLEGFVGVTGPIRIDEKRNAEKPVVIVRIANGKRTFVKALMP